MAAGTAIAIGMGAMAAGSSIMQGMAAKDQADYEAQVALERGRAESLAIEAEAEQLSGEQREMKAQQRVRAAQAGGGLSAGQNILLLAEQAQKMQMDQLELQRQSEIAVQGGQTEASLLRQRGKNAQTAGYLGAITSGAGSYFGAGGKTYLGSKPGKG